jgi:signal transduction histidine kinase
MNVVASRLVRRVLALQAVFALLGALLVALLAPRLLLLSGRVAIEGAAALGAGVLMGGLAAVLLTAARLRRYRGLLKALTVGSGSRTIEAHQLFELGDEPRRVILGWLGASAVGDAIATLPFAPRTLDPSTSVTLCLLGLAIVSAASLPLFVLLRTSFARALVLAPVESMREAVEDAERFGRIRGRVSRRMVLAVTLPVVCLALGAMLIVAGHLRRADERGREETARMLARVVLEPGPGGAPVPGMQDALLQARALGFFAYPLPDTEESRVERGRAGTITITMPLDRGSASIEFTGSTVSVVGGSELVVALCATAIAALLGIVVGRALGADLRSATRDLRELGTETGGGLRVLRSARFRVVADLGAAVARLAGRFRVFARAQERSIDARNAAARTRGMFFASVSHDLKSPLNAILGFTELVRQAQPITSGQAESLTLIERRGRELLALIETILDAARVEAGQLTLQRATVPLATVLEQGVQKARDLVEDREVQAVVEIGAGVGNIQVDRVQLSRALATFVAYAMREATAPSIRIVALAELPVWTRLDIEIPSERFDEVELAALLDPPDAPGSVEHRGLALALRLGRSVVELHGGLVIAFRRGGAGGFSLLLPAEP